MSNNTLDNTSFYQTVGNKIKVARTEKNFDQETFGSAVNLTRTSIINIEKGRQRPSLHHIWLMAQFLGIPITDLIPPLSLENNQESWKQKVEDNIDLKNRKEKQIVLKFISAITNK